MPAVSKKQRMLAGIAEHHPEEVYPENRGGWDTGQSGGCPTSTSQFDQDNNWISSGQGNKAECDTTISGTRTELGIDELRRIVNKILLQSEDKVILIKEIEKLFHGKVTIHFAHGVPKKVEMNKVEDITLS